MEEWMPGATHRFRAAKACMYSLTPDGQFVVDRHPSHPRLIFCGGFSGHGFKFAPVIGEIAADLALQGDSRHEIAFLSLQRFAEAMRSRASLIRARKEHGSQGTVRGGTIDDRRIRAAGGAFREWVSERRLDALSGRGRPLSSLRLPRLSVGESHAHRQAYSRAGERHRPDRGRSSARRARLGLSRRPGIQPRSRSTASDFSARPTRDRSGFDGRVTVPVLWDKETRRIVNNSEDDICRMFDGAFGALGKAKPNFSLTRSRPNRPSSPHLSTTK